MRRAILSFIVFLLCFCCMGAFAETPIQGAMNRVLARMGDALTGEQLMKADAAVIAPFITDEDRRVFATEYWRFDANVPVVVSVLRDEKQPVAPFWLEEAGFNKTNLKARNEEYTYEVWQKAFDAGRIGLGINGFDKHRPHYFVVVGPQRPGDKVILTRFFPADQQIFEMKPGSYTYHDWPDLVLTDVPDELKGQILLPTIRGRAREAHLIGAFRQTPYPSTEKPDHVLLTWNGDPRTTQAIQWRCKSPGGTVRYREAGAENDAPWIEVKPACRPLVDRLILNDRETYRCTAVLDGLKPGTRYAYSIEPAGVSADFTTAPAGGDPFTFFWLSDTHNNPVTGDLLAAGLAKCPKPAFCTISGDLVGTGQHRDDWDCLFNHAAAFTPRFPVMPSMGNHDNIDGMGPELYCAMFALPANGPAGLETGRAYSFQYGDALFLMPDVTAPVEMQAPWIERQLQGKTTAWTFAVLHFPPYAPDDENPEIVENWLPLFDAHHVDFVLTGHVHNYLRTYPMKAGQRVESTRDGTIYCITVSVGGRPQAIPKPEYAAVFDASGTPLCVAFQVDSRTVTSRAFDKSGKIVDEYTVAK
ncbi:MAG TPA: metallophosphoesterase family protein [Candidatus Hydrogenedentes bacterium]|nr:metallophosphoesterase family protein [Candidatus Hydrogenedentota bacterium]HRT21910.1 metallophosphoesterase family protein [Candidatus Hydrogenedentota bacterium]HRT65897.1 metallophosphoesterase family protein [Candidatus Hydrogenedentota bacterium]